ncbi:coiled-coil domain-containing protein 96 [Nematostella vectensis]|uniref:coiled-coil domain-containing protein 96 n=1 Tax=Nematostella vectensis TaxID=45351 RepID=UPI00207756A0|nr:coiled-coil domain-containing protein 96 [Nematostella vectensis]
MADEEGKATEATPPEATETPAAEAAPAEAPSADAEVQEEAGEEAIPATQADEATTEAQPQIGAAENPATDAAEDAKGEEEPTGEGTVLPPQEGDQPQATDIPEDNAPIPENEGVPEQDTDPTLEVAEPLSREGSPTAKESSGPPTDIPDATLTPPPNTQSPVPDEGPPAMQQYQDMDDQMYEDDEDYYEDSEPEVPIYNRQELIEKYHQALEERSSLMSLNAQLQHKLAEYFRKKKSDERQQEVEKNVTDQEQRYLKYMSNLEELQNEEKREQESFKSQIEDLKTRCQEKQEAVEKSSADFTKFKFDVAKQAINSRSGKPIPPKDIEQYELAEMKKEQEVTLVRLDNIKLKNRLKKREMQLKAKEELAEGLHLIDFEQLKIENQTYNEKIEERNEELLKLRKKITTTVQVLTHLKEKLQFVQAENGDQRTSLRSVEAQAAQKRDILTRTKQVRDALRIENVKLRQKCGLLGNEPLLRDYEVRKDQSDDLNATIENLKMRHAALTMNCAGVRRKIEEARQDDQP